MKVNLIILLVFFVALSTKTFAQCPANAASLAAGGNFSGDCTISIGLEISIIGTINWNGGTLTLNGGSGRIIVNNGVSLNVVSGSVVTVDDGDSNGLSDGPVRVLSDGTINVSSGASLICAEAISVNGTLNVYGTMESLRSTFSISGATASINIFSTGSLITNGTGDNLVGAGGSLNVDGDLATAGDLEINGGSATVSQNGTIDVGDDLLLYSDGSLLIENGAVVTITDDFANADDNPVFPTLSGNGSVNVQGQLEIGGDLTIYDTTPNSELLGTATGVITVIDAFSDAECANYAAEDYTFCSCTGGGNACNSVLPVELVSFTVQQLGGHVQVKWTTASELNNDFFVVERFNDMDNIIALKEISGHGTTNQLNEYNFIDTSPNFGTNYYRLKQVDFNGLFNFSPIVKIDFELPKNELLIFPNPCIDQTLHVWASNLPPNTLFTLTILSLHGYSYISKNITTNFEGDLSIMLEVTDLSSGIYIVSVAGLKTTFVK